MTTNGIGTHSANHMIMEAGSSRVTLRRVANRVQANKAVTNRVKQQAIVNRVVANSSVGSRVDIAA